MQRQPRRRGDAESAIDERPDKPNRSHQAKTGIGFFQNILGFLTAHSLRQRSRVIPAKGIPDLALPVGRAAPVRGYRLACARSE